MTYWFAFPLAFFMLSPLLLERWSGSYVGDKFQMSIEEAWSADSDGARGQVRTSEGTVGPPRN
jgi:hypothetical protein